MSSPAATPRRLPRPRFPESARARARLRAVPVSVSTIPRAGFVVLISILLMAGVVGLLAFNTSMQQASFEATKLDRQATVLAARQQALELQVAALRDPQHVALAARHLGMVPPPAPAFIDLRTGDLLGVALPALPGDAMRVTPLPAARPKSLTPREKIVKVTLTKAQLRRLERDKRRAAQDQAAETTKQGSGG